MSDRLKLPPTRDVRFHQRRKHDKWREAAPPEPALEVPVADSIKEALLHRTGRCGKLYQLVLSYEAANWNAINELAEEVGIPNHLLTSVYFICMENVNLLWEQLTNAYPNQEDAPTEAGAPDSIPS